MKELLLALAVLLLSGAFAHADNPFIPNDNDHKDVLGFALERNARSGIQVFTSSYRGGVAMMPTGIVSRASSNFLRYRADGDNK